MMMMNDDFSFSALTVGWVTGLQEVGGCFVGGGDLTRALHDL